MVNYDLSHLTQPENQKVVDLSRMMKHYFYILLSADVD